ncbi:unnamed protein product [Arctogadus glacialis]
MYSASSFPNSFTTVTCSSARFVLLSKPRKEAMETSEIPTTETGQTQESFNVVMNSKPLHLFIKRETQTLGIVVLMFGCAELLMASELFFIYDLSYVYMSFGFSSAGFFPFQVSVIHPRNVLCVSGLLIFLSTAARRALKSTQSQVIVQHIKPAMTLETIPTE